MNDTEKFELICRGLVSIRNKPLTMEIAPNTTLASAGLDSLDSIELQLWIEGTLEREIPDPTSAPVTFKDLMGMI